MSHKKLRYNYKDQSIWKIQKNLSIVELKYEENVQESRKIRDENR